MRVKETLEKPERLYDYSPREIYAKLYALELILKHLKLHANDHRKKERMRIKIATKYIYGWIETGRKIYDSHSCERSSSKGTEKSD